MHVTFRCPNCDQSQRSDCHADGAVECRCGWAKRLTEQDLQGETPQRCLVCETTDLWRQKDFPPKLGWAFVIVAGLISSYFFYHYQPIRAFAVLMVVALIDMLLYRLLPDVLVCYRCQSRHGQVDLTGREAYDHELGERYRQEEIRLQANMKS
ncbi:MAG: hypothetical protein DWH91_14760 [Planctomycetota bacterium]|nr:MAG: hypothetical protein DWH91_14760 [Planctomycetota bacterium]